MAVPVRARVDPNDFAAAAATLSKAFDRVHAESRITRTLAWRIPTAPERRVRLLQRAAVCLFGPRGSIVYLHTPDAVLGTTPAAAAWEGGPAARVAGEQLRAFALKVSATGDFDRQVAPD